jgi:23S rRNA pseudouridine2604 synthase
MRAVGSGIEGARARAAPYHAGMSRPPQRPPRPPGQPGAARPTRPAARPAPTATPRPADPPRADTAEAEGERLAKRLARELGCSRSEAERYIESGMVTVDGVVVDTPPSRVRDAQRVALVRGATLSATEPVTLLLNKPPGLVAGDAADGAAGLLQVRHRATGDRVPPRVEPAHLRRQLCLTPLETTAGGLLVFSQDPRIARRLTEDASQLEHETMVDVAGAVAPALLARLAIDPAEPRAPRAMRVSIGSSSDETTRLRFAIKGHQPGRIERACADAGLKVLAISRLRIGRVPLAGVPVGEWRYLGPEERF